MKKIALLFLLFVATMSAYGQQTPPPPVAPKNTVVRRIKIRHADPALIALLLAGKTTFSTPPEISTVIKRGR